MRRVRRVQGQRTDSADQEYINYRLPVNGEGNTVVEPTLLDGLSFPLTFLWATFKVSTCGRRAGRSGGLTDQIKVGLRAALPALATERRLTVVVMGGSERAEERLLLQTTYFQEISAYFPGVAVHPGPERPGDVEGSLLTGRLRQESCLESRGRGRGEAQVEGGRPPPAGGQVRAVRQRVCVGVGGRERPTNLLSAEGGSHPSYPVWRKVR